MSRCTWVPNPALVYSFYLQDYHLLWSAFPGCSIINIHKADLTVRSGPATPRIAAGFRLFPFRSPLLRESMSFSIPRATEMFQFARFRLPPLFLNFQSGILRDESQWIAPFGNPRIRICLRLPEAYRSLPRPSSPVCAKSSTISPL